MFGGSKTSSIGVWMSRVKSMNGSTGLPGRFTVHGGKIKVSVTIPGMAAWWKMCGGRWIFCRKLLRENCTPFYHDCIRWKTPHPSCTTPVIFWGLFSNFFLWPAKPVNTPKKAHRAYDMKYFKYTYSVANMSGLFFWGCEARIMSFVAKISLSNLDSNCFWRQKNGWYITLRGEDFRCFFPPYLLKT